MNDQEITIEEWAQSEIETMNNFVKFWKEKQNEDLENYPNSLLPGDWDEQYMLYST